MSGSDNSTNPGVPEIPEVKRSWLKEANELTPAEIWDIYSETFPTLLRISELLGDERLNINEFSKRNFELKLKMLEQFADISRFLNKTPDSEYTLDEDIIVDKLNNIYNTADYYIKDNATKRLKRIFKIIPPSSLALPFREMYLSRNNPYFNEKIIALNYSLEDLENELEKTIKDTDNEYNENKAA